MCGIYGIIGHPDPTVLRLLTVINRERGTDSLGYFTPKERIRRAGDPLDALADPEVGGFLSKSRRAWFCVGHTRQATRGKATEENAHPFRYGRFIGAHNGIVDAPATYAVDSEYLIDRLHQCNGDYQTAFADIDGYWGLVWFDGEELFLQAYGTQIAIARKGKSWVFSSSWDHLEAAGYNDVAIIDHGTTLRFNCKGECFTCPAFVPNKRSYKVKWNWSDKDALREIQDWSDKREATYEEEHYNAWSAYTEDFN